MSRIKPNAQMVLMYALGLVLTGILTILSCKPTQDVHVASLQSVNWLQGRWTSSLEGQYENFILIDDNFIERVIYQVEDGQPVISERGKIFEKDATLAMTTTIFNTKNNEFSKFELIGQNINRVTFRNIEEDDPYLIILQLMDDGKLVISEMNQFESLIKKYELTRNNLP